MQEVIGKVLLDDVALVAAANDEVIDAVVGISLQDVPQDRLAADLDHGFGAGVGFFADACAQATGKNDCFQNLVPFKLTVFTVTAAAVAGAGNESYVAGADDGYVHLFIVVAGVG